MEFDLDKLTRLQARRQNRPILRQPATNQEIAVITPADRTAERIRAVILANTGPLLESVDLFDVYAGPPVPEGQRSLAFRMGFRAADRTLEDAEVSKIREKVARRLESELGAAVRV